MQLNALGLQSTALDGVSLIQHNHSRPGRHHDARGQTQSVFDAPHFAAFGLPTRYMADRLTHSYQGSLYGIYHDTDTDMAQLFTVLRGEVFMVAVDLRPRRKTFGQAISFILNEQTPQCYLAPGIGWGYAVQSETADLLQKFTALPVAHQINGILWNDPELNITWPFKRPIISPDDAQFPSLETALTRLTVPAREVVIR